MNNIESLTIMRQLFIFMFVGGSAFIIHLLTVYILVNQDILSPLTANIFGFLLSFNISFFGHYFLTFAGNRAIISCALRRLFLLASFNFIANEYCYYILLNILHLHYLIALVINLSTLAIITFFVSKFWVFKQEEII